MTSSPATINEAHLQKRDLVFDDPWGEKFGDITLHGRSCWISVGNISVRIAKTPYEVHVELYPKGDEKEELLIDSARASFRKKYRFIEK